MWLIELKVLVSAQEGYDWGAVGIRCTNHPRSLSSLEVALHHLVVLSIAKCKWFQLPALQPTQRYKTYQPTKRDTSFRRYLPEFIDELATLIAEADSFWIPLNFQRGEIGAVGGKRKKNLVNVNPRVVFEEPSIRWTQDAYSISNGENIILSSTKGVLEKKLNLRMFTLLL